jgi:hypothetical protein
MADLNLQEIHDFMIEVARKAADRITSATPTTDSSGSKKNCMFYHDSTTCPRDIRFPQLDRS